MQQERYYCYNIFNNKQHFKICGNEFDLQGNSIGSVMSCFYIKQFNLLLDAGTNSPFTTIDNILITHTHGDHIQALGSILCGLTTKPNIYCPIGTSQYIYNFLLNNEKLNRCTNEIDINEFNNRFHITEIQPNQIFPISKNKYIKGIETFHNVPSIGYQICESRKKLREEFKSKTKEELIELNKNKADIYENILIPIFIYTGDTTTKWIEMNQQLLNTPLIITDCTFIEAINRTPINEKDYQHSTLEKLVPYIKLNEKTQFMLTHLSPKYDTNEILNEFNKYNLTNTKILF